MLTKQSPEEQERITYLIAQKELYEKKINIVRKELLSLIYKLDKKIW